MKRTILILTILCVSTTAWAQLSPIQVTVQRLAKKKAAEQTFTVDNATPGIVTAHAGNYSDSESLRITISNPGLKPVNDLKLRWGFVISQRSFELSHAKSEIAYGAEEMVNLTSKETKVIDTPPVEVKGKEFYSGDTDGGKIRGYGVQVLSKDRMLFEQFTPPTCRKAFNDLRPVEESIPKAADKGPAPIPPPAENTKKPTKAKKDQ